MFAPRAVIVVLALGLAASSGLAADRGARSKSSPGRPAGTVARGSNPPSIEPLTERALKSLVVISQFSRDGDIHGVGAGFIVSPDGLIATSLHVIGEGRAIHVTLPDGRKLDVTEVHAWDRNFDLAVIRVAAKNLPALPLGDSDELKQGAAVVAIGNPQGLDHSVVQGVVSAKRDIEGMEMIQVAIPIEPGNSGGPLIDLEGRVHGILTLKSAVTANLGFAIPVNALKSLLDQPNPTAMDRWLTIGSLNPLEWTPLFGARWTQRAGRIQVEGPGQGFGGRSLCLSGKTVPALPYEIGVTVKLDDETGAAGLVFGADGGHRHYGFYPSAGQMRLTRFEGADVFSWQVLHQVRARSYRPGEWNRLKVRVEPERILCFVNDELVAEEDAGEFVGVKAGLAKFRDTKAEFKEFEVGRRIGLEAIPEDVAGRIAAEIEALAASSKPPAALVDKLKPHARATQTVLLERARKLDEQAGRLRQLARVVHRKSVEEELVRVLAAPESEINLLRAALLVAHLDNPDLDLDAYERRVQQMAAELKLRLPKRDDDRAQLDTLLKYLFAEGGFHGSRTEYYSRANSHVNEVLDDREGLPITLSVIVLELARRCGLESLTGIPLPGHFVVRFQPRRGAAQFIDAFDRGRRLTRTEAEDLVRESTGGRARDEHFEPATKRQIIIRMVRNLLGAAEREGTSEAALPYLELLVALEPDSAADRFSRGRARLQSGDVEGAKEDFRWLLENTPPGVDVRRLQELYRSL
jgi:regulator of sirC expression with transglutaminase-like and TPR domain